MAILHSFAAAWAAVKACGPAAGGVSMMARAKSSLLGSF